MTNQAKHQDPSEARDPASWAPCPEGELAGLANRLVAHDRRQARVATLKTAGAVAAAAAVLAVGIGLMVGPGPMDCPECVANFQAFHGHLVEQAPMDGPTYERMVVHLQDCEKCRAYFDSKYPGTLLDAGLAMLGAGSVKIALCVLPLLFSLGRSRR